MKPDQPINPINIAQQIKKEKNLPKIRVWNP